jgi:hypothetical protein
MKVRVWATLLTQTNEQGGKVQAVREEITEVPDDTCPERMEQVLREWVAANVKSGWEKV